MTGDNRITFRAVPTDRLHPNPDNPRDDLGDLDELAASIRTNGILQPLVVNNRAGRYVVTDGHRRLAAAKLAHVQHVPCFVTPGADDRRVLTTMLAAALHRELKPIEQAHALDRLRTEQGLTIAEIARATGYTQAKVRARLLLLELPPDAQRMVEDEQLTLTQATDLAREVKARGTGSSAVKTKRATSHAYFNTHPLASTAKVSCELAGHRDTRQLLGGQACAPCFETAIRDDERTRTRQAG